MALLRGPVGVRLVDLQDGEASARLTEGMVPNPELHNSVNKSLSVLPDIKPQVQVTDTCTGHELY